MVAAAPLPADGQDAAAADSSWTDIAGRSRRGPRPHLPTDRVRQLLLLGLLGAAAAVLWLRLLAVSPHLPLTLAQDSRGQVVLDQAADPGLRQALGQPVRALLLADGQQLLAEPALLPRSARWTLDDDQRLRQDRLAERLVLALQQPQLTVVMADDRRWALTPGPRGLGGLGALCWAVCALALALYLAGVVTLLSQPNQASAVFGVLALAQALNLLLMAAGALPGLGQPGGLVALDGPLRTLADLVSGAALVHVLVLYPRRLARPDRWAAGVWAGAVLGGGLLLLARPPGAWWWTQALLLTGALAAATVLRTPAGSRRHPLAQLLQRLVLAGTGTLVLLTLAMALAAADGAVAYQLASTGSVAWYVFFASLLILGPFLSRSRQVLREFTLLAGVITVTTSLHLLLLARFDLAPVAAMTLAGAVSLVVFALARPWVLDQLAGPGELSAERMFDSLYRAARELEQSPGSGTRQLTSLLREVFEPLEVGRTGRPVPRVRVTPDGATLVVPVPHAPGAEGGGILLHHARRGRRLFTQEDQRLCERLLEQLHRAVAYDRAVEHGRTEERARIAQDLHDDIGARLLTLMYKAPSAEIEEYIRHTLQDLKTLTRGLAAANHPFSHAAAEWKADLTQRLSAAGCTLHWSLQADRDLTLTVVQWSALTRVLRELVNNIITHARAGQVEITLQLERGQLALQVADDGIGRAPEAWKHGLGLGGVRKRVKLLGGQVRWVVREGGGIRCEVRAPIGPPRRPIE